MIVIDASVALEMLLPTAAGLRLVGRLEASAPEVWAPHLLDVEVMQATRRYQRQGVLSEAGGAEIARDLADLPIVRCQHEVLLPRIWELRHNLSAYDAAYIALAEALDATLLTCDAPLARAPGNNARVEFIER